MSIVGMTNRYMSSALDYIDLNSCTDVLTTTLAGQSSSSGSTSAYTGYATNSTDGAYSASSTSAASISSAASLLSSLASLQKSDLSSFEDVAGSVADDLNAAAAKTDDASEKYQLTKLAAQFSNASTTGSMTALTSTGTSSSLRGYGASSSSSLLSSLLSGGLSTDVYRDVTGSVRTRLAEAAEAS